MTRQRTAAGILAGLLLASAGLRAEESSGWTTSTHEALAGAVNPLGLQNTLERSWQRPLFASRRRLLADAHLAFGLADRLTPAYDRLGLWVEVAPLSILEVQAGLEPAVYFGTFKSLLAFESYDAPFDDATRRARAHEAGPGLAGRAYLRPTLKLAAGRLAFRARADFEWWKAGIDGGYFYEPARDVLLRSRGDTLVTSETLLLWRFAGGPDRKLLLGVVHDLTHVWAAPRNRKQDVGLVGIVGLGRQALGLRQPTLVVKVFRYVEDRYRRDELGGQVAFGFDLGRTR